MRLTTALHRAAAPSSASPRCAEQPEQHVGRAAGRRPPPCCAAPARAAPGRSSTPTSTMPRSIRISGGGLGADAAGAVGARSRASPSARRAGRCRRRCRAARGCASSSSSNALPCRQLAMTWSHDRRLAAGPLAQHLGVVDLAQLEVPAGHRRPHARDAAVGADRFRRPRRAAAGTSRHASTSPPGWTVSLADQMAVQQRRRARRSPRRGAPAARSSSSRPSGSTVIFSGSGSDGRPT